MPEESEETEEVFRRQRPIALKIAQKAVKLANIPQTLPNDEKSIKNRWRVFYTEENQDVSLTILLNPTVTRAAVHISLGLVAWGILIEVENLLSNPKATETLAVEESDREVEIFNKTLQLTQDYIRHLPLVLFHSFHQALNETMINHIKKFVDYDMRDHLDKTDKPDRKFTLLPNNTLNDVLQLFPDVELNLIQSLQMIDGEFSTYRRAVLSDRQVWLTPEAFAKLPSDYEELRLQYKDAKKKYTTEYKSLKATNRRSTFEEDWKKHWETFINEEFPNLYLFEEIPNYTAAELAYQQIGNLYGISASYMERLISNARQQAIGKARKSKMPDNKM